MNKLELNQRNLTIVLTILAIIADIALIVNVIHHW
jgi:hypothetical protein